jgi:hypothetical protein
MKTTNPNADAIAYLANEGKVDADFFIKKCILNDGSFDENDRMLFIYMNAKNADREKEQSVTAEVQLPKESEAVQNCESNSIGSVDIEDKSSIRNDTQIPLVDDALFIRTNILLAGFSKVGKTLFSIWLAFLGFNQQLIKKACFFSFEDLNGQQMPRFQEGLSGLDYDVFTAKMWDDKIAEEEKKIEDDASWTAFIYQTFPFLLKYFNIKEKLLKDADVLKKIPFKLIVFLKILTEKINEGYDFFVLDSLSTVFDGINNLPDRYIKALLETPGKKVTFVIIHHNSGKGEVYGKASIKRLFDTVCNLSKLEALSENGSTFLKGNLEGRFSTKEALFIKREKVSENVAKHTLLNASECSDYITLNSGTGTLKDAILSYIRNCGEEGCLVSVLFEAVKHLQKRESVGSVNNQLRFLRNEGLIEEVDKPWIKVRAI